MADLAVVTNVWRAIAARVYSRDVAEVQREITRFKIGEGGYNPAAWPHVPLAPDATRTDLVGEGAPLTGGGTVTFTNGGFGVVGIGTTFLADVAAGEWVKPGPTVSANPYSAGTPGTEVDEWGQVLHVVDNLNLTLSAPYAGATLAGRECRKASEPLFVFRKNLAAGDVTFSAPMSTRVDYLLTAGEALADQLGTSPDFFELGAFDSDGCLLIYCTMDERTKVGVALALATLTTF